MNGDNMEINYQYMYKFGILLMILSMVLSPQLIQLHPIVFLILFFGGILIFFYGVFRQTILQSKGAVIEDERTKIIKYKTGFYTLFITVTFIILLSALNTQKIIEITLGHLIWILIIQIGITSIILHFYLNKKKNL